MSPHSLLVHTAVGRHARTIQLARLCSARHHKRSHASFDASNSACPLCRQKRRGATYTRATNAQQPIVKEQQQEQQQQQQQQPSFESWWQQAGVKADALTPADFAGLRGMSATTLLDKGQNIVVLPRAAALLVTPKMKCPFPDMITSDFWSKSQWFIKMALMLLHERKQGSASPVSGYITQLPQQFSTLLHWSEEELQLLMYPHLIQQVQQQRQSWHEYYESMRTSSPGLQVSEEDFVWALECVRSRAFSGPYSGPPIKDRAKLVAPFALLAAAYTQLVHLALEQVLNGAIAAVLFNIIYDTLLSRRLRWFAMCPVIDSMNHQSTSQNEVAYEYFGDRFTVTAERKYAKGEQVFIMYGLQSNDKLLQYYGFVEPKNPADVYVIPDLLEAVRQLPYLVILQDRLAAVIRVCSKVSLQQVSVNKQGVSDVAMQAMRMLTASPELYGRHQPSDFANQVDPLNEEAVLQALRDICQRLVDTTKRISAKQSDAKVSHDKQDLARAFRQEKSRILQACCRNLEARLRKLHK